MEFNEIESPDVIKHEIQTSILFKIRDQVQSLYKSEVFIGYTEIYNIIHPCLYVKEMVSKKILFFKYEKVEKRLITEVSLHDSSEITVFVFDSVIYPIARNEFEKLGKEHERSITKINIVKDS